MEEKREFKCPSCGGAIEFDSRSQTLKCPYCDSQYPIETVNQMTESDRIIGAEDAMDNWDTAMHGTWSKGESDGLRSYVCRSCGGEIIGDETMGAASCPFCGNPIVIGPMFADTLKPDLVIPFKLDKKAAREALEKHLSGKKLLPAVFREAKHLEEIKGLYVPFWLYSAKVTGNVRFHGTTIRHWSRGNYDYTETKHYALYRTGDVGFANIPVDGSAKMPDDLMDSLEPFDFSDAVDFNTAYLAGYFADKYDVTVEDNLPRINVRVKHSTEDVLRTTVPPLYQSVVTEQSHIDLHGGSAKYALLPVWLLRTTWNGKEYTFAMNGQTGKFIGNLPMDRKLYWKYWLRALAVSAAAEAAIGLAAYFLMR